MAFCRQCHDAFFSSSGRDASTAQPAWLASGQYQKDLGSDCRQSADRGLRLTRFVATGKDMGNETGLAQVTPYKLMDALKDSIVKRGTGSLTATCWLEIDASRFELGSLLDWVVSARASLHRLHDSLLEVAT